MIRGTHQVAVTPNSTPTRPQDLDAQPGNREVLLAWSANTETDLAGYSVFRGDMAGGPYDRLTQLLMADPEYQDTTGELGQTYYYVVTAVDELGAESEASQEASAAPTHARVLLVNDEGDSGYAAQIATSIRDADYFVDQWDIRSDGSPMATDLTPYNVVIWNLGPEYSATISADEQLALADYVNQGGHLAVFGQDLLYDLGLTNQFVIDVLHVSGGTQDAYTTPIVGVTGDAIGDGLLLELDSPFENRTDTITGDADAIPVFVTSQGDPVAVRTEDLLGTTTLFAAFPFEGVSETDPDPNNKAAVMQRILEQMLPALGSGDLNGSGQADAADLAQWIAVYHGAADPLGQADVNQSESLEIADLLTLIAIIMQ